MAFQVGDKVTIKDTINAGELYRGIYFNSDMNIYRGRVLTIKSVNGSIVRIEEDGDAWTWTKEMFEKADQPKPKKKKPIPQVPARIREKEVVKAVEAMKKGNFGLTGIKVELEADLSDYSDTDELDKEDFLLERMVPLGLAEENKDDDNYTSEHQNYRPKHPLVYCKFYDDGTVNSEFTFTLAVDKAKNVLLLKKIVDIFNELIENEGISSNHDRAGMHMALLNSKGAIYNPDYRPKRTEYKRFGNFQKSMTLMLPALYFLSSCTGDTRYMQYRLPRIGSGQLRRGIDSNYFSPSNTKFSAIAYRGGALEFRVFDPCYERPEQILDNVIVMKNAMKYWRKKYRSPGLEKIVESVKFGHDNPGHISSMYVTVEHIDLLNKGLQRLKPDYYSVRQLKDQRGFCTTKHKMNGKIKRIKAQAEKEYAEYQDRFDWESVLYEQQIILDQAARIQRPPEGKEVAMRRIKAQARMEALKYKEKKKPIDKFIEDKVNVEVYKGKNIGQYELKLSEEG